jgi:hypothetical protein
LMPESSTTRSGCLAVATDRLFDVPEPAHCQKQLRPELGDQLPTIGRREAGGLAAACEPAGVLDS